MLRSDFGALTVLPARVGSELVIDKVIFDEGAETFEIIPVSPGQFSGSVTYDWSGMTLTDGSINLPLDTLQEQGPSGGAQIVNGNIVFNIKSSEIAALKTNWKMGRLMELLSLLLSRLVKHNWSPKPKLIVHFQFNYRPFLSKK